MLTTEVSVQDDKWFPALQFVPFLNAEAALRSSGAQSTSKALQQQRAPSLWNWLSWPVHDVPAPPGGGQRRRAGFQQGCFLTCPSDTCPCSGQEWHLCEVSAWKWASRAGLMSLCFSVKAKPRCLSGLRPCRGAAATRRQAVSAGKHRCCRKASPRVNPGSCEGWACCVPAGVQNLLGLCALIAWKVVFPFPLFIFNAESAQNCSKL